MRPLKPGERAVIARLLSVDFPEVQYFRAQLAVATVSGECACGCGTIQLAIDQEAAPPAPSRAWEGPDVIVEGDRRSWLMLCVADGYLTELEHVPAHGPPPVELDAASIEPDVQVADDWFR